MQFARHKAITNDVPRGSVAVEGKPNKFAIEVDIAHETHQVLVAYRIKERLEVDQNSDCALPLARGIFGSERLGPDSVSGRLPLAGGDGPADPLALPSVSGISPGTRPKPMYSRKDCYRACATFRLRNQCDSEGSG